MNQRMDINLDLEEAKTEILIQINKANLSRFIWGKQSNQDVQSDGQVL